MTTIDPDKKIQRIRTEQEMRVALLNLLERKHTLSVPPQVEDADMVLSDVIEELLEARKTIEQYKAQSEASKLRAVMLRWIEDGKEQTFTTDDMEALRTKAQALFVQENVEKIMLPEPAMTTREEAERVANAGLVQYEEPKPAEEDEEAFFAIGFEFPLPIPEGATSAAMYRGVGRSDEAVADHAYPIPLPVVDQERLDKARKEGKPFLFMGSPSDSLQDIEKLREELCKTPRVQELFTEEQRRYFESTGQLRKEGAEDL